MRQSVIPETGFLRLKHILGDKKLGLAPLIPVSRSAWFQGVREGTYPKGILLSSRVRGYRATDIRALIEAAR